MTKETPYSDDRTKSKKSRRRIFVTLILCIGSLLFIAFAGFSSFCACGNTDDSFRRTNGADQMPEPNPSVSQQTVPVCTYEVINSWTHDTKAFTQGLVFYQGSLYESTGKYGSSSLRKVDLRTGKIKKKIDLDSQTFAEGIAIYQGKIYQLTWTEHKAFVYDVKSFRLEGELSYESEGWGLTHDEHQLIMSDGTNQLRFIDPATFKATRTISVFDNELEYVKGEIYANVWKSDRIARIDPDNGKLIGWIDLKGLLPYGEHPNSEDVLNGIAYDETDDRLFVTGKRWPKIFEIRLKRN
jgi:glutamine cyclotransferase